MRAIFVGASTTALMAAKKALENGHDAVVVERDEARIDAVAEEFDCSFVHEDGSRPATLESLGPDNTDMLFCLTDNDHDNIIGGLVARTLGFDRVVVRIKDAELEPICAELGLTDVLVPSREIGHSLVDLLEGREPPQLSSVLGGGWRFWGFTVGEVDECTLETLKLPSRAQVIAVTRDGESQLARDTTDLREGDQVLLLCHEEVLDGVCERIEALSGDAPLS